MAKTLREAFEEFKSRLELSDSFQEEISRRHETIRKWVEKFGYKTKLIGSLQRKTRINPRKDDTFDIDILAIMVNATPVAFPKVTPQKALDQLYKAIIQNERYAKMEPEKDYPTVVIEYANNIKVELVPAYSVPIIGGYFIPKNRNEWDIADYDYDADYISKKNQESNGLLIPTIKMLKAIKRGKFPMMKSYHLEVLATNILSDLYYPKEPCEGSTSYWCLLMYFFEKVRYVLCDPESIKIPGSNSRFDCSYLKNEDLLKLKKILDLMYKAIYSIVTEYYNNRDEKKAIERFREIIGDPFPAYG